MRIRSLAAALLLALLLPGGVTRGEEPILPFLAGLRAREYYDTGLQYLDSLEKRSDLPAEIRQVIPYERAAFLSAQARELRDPAEQAKQLESARLLLTKFLASGAKHPRIADANSDLGQLLLTRGRMQLLQLRSSGNPAQRATLQKQARDDFTQARPVLETALKLYKEKYDSFPKQIDRSVDKVGYEAREQAMGNFIKAQFDLGTCTFEEAHTYDVSNPEFKILLSRAAGEFEKIYQQFRTNGAGIHALLFQGKCFQEQGEFGKALGIFDQILKLQEETGRLRPLQDQARHLRLVCLGDDKRPDLKGVKAEAEEWLKTASPAAKRGRSGLGIQWELAQALDKLAKDKETTAAEKDLYLKQALATVQFIHQFPSEFKEPSGVLQSRLNSALKIKGTAAPRDFDAAYNAAIALVTEIEKRNKALADAKPEDKANLEKAFELHLRGTAQALRLAMSLYTVRDSMEELNKARMALSQIYYELQDHSYEAAILAEHIATRYKSVDDKLAQDAAYLSMAAYMQAYLAAPESQRKADIDRLLAMGNYLVEQWPNTERSNEALMMLGRMYSQIQEPSKAAEFYNRVPEAAPTYLEAQLAAGLAYWQGYAALAVLPEKTRPSKTELAGMMQKAQQILKQAVQKAEAKLAKGKPSSDALNAAKLSLVQILNQSGSYKEAITLLNDGDRSLTKEVAVENPKSRPERGTKSQLFASLTYRELLRSYVGTQDVEKARAALKQLETLETGGAAGLNTLLRDLGQQLQGEVQRLQQSNDPRLGEVMSSFEKFLADLLARKDGQDYTMLLWIAETYVALGDGVKEGNQAKANELYKQAADANQAILKLAAEKPAAVPAAALPSIRLRLVACQRKQQAFDAAVTEIRKILKEKPQNILEAQIEAARIYTDWGFRGGNKDGEKWLLAVMGDKASKLPPAERLIWGWQDLSSRLLNSLKSRANPQIQKIFLDARYNVIVGKYHYALEQPKAETKQSLLQAARLEVLATGILTTLDKADADRKRYDVIFREVQTELNKISGSKAEVVGIDVALKGDSDKPDAADDSQEKELAGKSKSTDKKAVAGGATDAAPEKEPAEDAPKKKSSKAKKTASKKKPKSSGSSTAMIVTIVVLLAAAGGGGYFYYSKLKQAPKRSGRRRGAESESDATPAEKKTVTRKRRPLPASPPEEIE